MKSAKESREQFIEKKECIERLLDQTIETFRLDDHKEAVKVVEKLKESFEKEEYTIIVVGEFSAGKSTLLNALMGRRILTSFTSETTATVNFLRHKSVACAVDIDHFTCLCQGVYRGEKYIAAHGA